MRRATKGFTLIELLVVVGIIALLMSILLPALNKARENARGIKCASNEKQILLACIMYANENKSFLPISPRIGDDLGASNKYGDYLAIDMGQVIMPGQKIVLIEEQFPNDGCAYVANATNLSGSNDSDDQFTNRHLKRGNQGFADGHVEAVYPEDFGFHTNEPGGETMSLTQNDIRKRQAYCDLEWRP